MRRLLRLPRPAACKNVRISLMIWIAVLPEKCDSGIALVYPVISYLSMNFVGSSFVAHAWFAILLIFPTRNTESNT